MPNLTTLNDDNRARVLKYAALMVAGLKDPDTAAAATGLPHVTADQLLELASSDEGARAIAVELERMDDRGELLTVQARVPLEKLIGRMGEMIDAGEVTASAAPKFADVLFKMTGLAEERAARLRAQMEDDAPKATIFILRPGDADPSPEKPNEHRIVIDLRHGQNNPRDVIDVTPSDEGGNDGA